MSLWSKLVAFRNAFELTKCFKQCAAFFRRLAASGLDDEILYKHKTKIEMVYLSPSRFRALYANPCCAFALAEFRL
jgi:hypothetical protein